MSEVKYSNAVEIQMQLFDVQLKFNLQNPDGIIDSTTVFLSPQHMKVLSQMLSNAVESYEQQFGSISLPENTSVKVENDLGVK